MYLSVQEQEEANSVLMRFETPHRVPVLNLTLSHIFLFACIKLRFVCVRSDAG